jgi:hypothetical protein
VKVVYIELPIVARQVESWQGANAPCHFPPIAVNSRQFNTRVVFFFSFADAFVRSRKIAVGEGVIIFFNVVEPVSFGTGITAAYTCGVTVTGTGTGNVSKNQSRMRTGPV